MIRITALTILLGLCLVGCSKSSEEAIKDQPEAKDQSAGLKEALAKKPRNLTENPLVKKGDQQVDPRTLELYSGKVFELHEKKKVVHKEGLLLNGKEHGLWTSYNTDGTKDSETNYKEGKEHGLQTDYYENGTKRETNYKEGKKHGLRTWYWLGGIRGYQTNYKEGKKHGLHTWYYLDGTKSLEVNYKEGKRHGQHRAWDPNGKLIHEEDFQMGTGKQVRMNYIDGTKTETNYKEGKKHGLETDYRRDGTKREECEWSNGVLGKCKTF